MNKEYIVYRCKVCGCSFAVERSYIKTNGIDRETIIRRLMGGRLY